MRPAPGRHRAARRRGRWALPACSAAARPRCCGAFSAWRRRRRGLGQRARAAFTQPHGRDRVRHRDGAAVAAARPGDEPDRCATISCCRASTACTAEVCAAAAPARRLVAELMELLDIRPRRPELQVSALSGGNQQKVILAKWLARAGGRAVARRADAGDRRCRQGADPRADPRLRRARRRRADVVERSRRARAFVRRGAGAASRPHRRAARPRRTASTRNALHAAIGGMKADEDRIAGELAGQSTADHADCAVRRHRAADQPLPVAAQPHQHPGAILDHGGDRHGHDLRHHRRRFRSLGRLDGGARGLHRRHGDGEVRYRRRRGWPASRPAPRSVSPTDS